MQPAQQSVTKFVTLEGQGLKAKREAVTRFTILENPQGISNMDILTALGLYKGSTKILICAIDHEVKNLEDI